MLKAGVSIDSLYRNNYYPLDFAIFSGKLETVKFLIERSASIKRDNLLQQSIFYKICTIKGITPEIVSYLLEEAEIPLPEEMRNNSFNPFIAAICSKNIDSFECFARNDFLRNKYGEYTLAFILKYRAPAMLYSMLKDYGVNDNIITLLASPEKGSFGLLKKKKLPFAVFEKIEKENLFGLNPLHWAILSNDPRRIEYILKIKPDYLNSLYEIGNRHKHKDPIVGFAISFRCMESFNYLADKKTKLNFERKDVIPPLGTAVICDNFQAVDKLIKIGASIEYVEKYFIPLLGYSLTKKGNSKIVKLLIEKGALTNGTYRNKCYIALAIDRFRFVDESKILKLLINAGAPMKGTAEYPDIIEYAKHLHKKYGLKNFDGLIKILKAAKAKK